MADEKPFARIELPSPGPWTIHSDGETVFAESVRVANCTTKAVGLLRDRRRANARLIAAAPEMFDAIAYALDEDNNWSTVRDVLRKAFVKAEGI